MIVYEICPPEQVVIARNCRISIYVSLTVQRNGSTHKASKQPVLIFRALASDTGSTVGYRLKAEVC